MIEIALVGALSKFRHRLHAVVVFDGHEKGSLCGFIDPSSTPERRRWDPDHPRACQLCVRRATETWNELVGDA